MSSNLRTGIYALIGGLALALGASASQAHDSRIGKHHGPKLVARPAHLADATNLAPGDRVQRLVELRVRGKGRFAAIYLRVRAKQSSALDAYARNGLVIAIDRCSKTWRGPRGAYSCRGRQFAVVSRRPLVGRIKLKRLGLRANRVAHLRLTLTFPAAADNGLQGQRTRAVYAFVGVTRPGARRR